MIEGYQSEQFSEFAKETLYSSLYTRDQNSNRMGYRLSGKSVHSPDISLLSEAARLSDPGTTKWQPPYCSA